MSQLEKEAARLTAPQARPIARPEPDPELRLELHSDGSTSEAGAGVALLREGAAVWYRGTDGREVCGRVCHVERDVGRGELPFYTVAFADGRERQTVAARLRPCLPAKEEEEEA